MKAQDLKAAEIYNRVKQRSCDLDDVQKEFLIFAANSSKCPIEHPGFYLTRNGYFVLIFTKNKVFAKGALMAKPNSEVYFTNFMWKLDGTCHNWDSSLSTMSNAKDYEIVAYFGYQTSFDKF